MIASTNPATGEVVRTFDSHSDSFVDQALARAAAAAAAWRRVPVEARAARLREAARLLDERKARYAALATLEMGKLRKAGIGEIEKCASACRHYAAEGPRYIATERIESDARRSEVRFQPLGVVLAVMPWNFPFWQCFRFAAPALLAGNVGVLKHASNVPQCALAIEEVLRDAGFPEGCFTTLLVEAKRVQRILEDPRVAAATLTGSEAAGRSLARVAGDQLKTTVLELGGSDPFVVLPSANLDKAVEFAVRSRMQNAGQSCIAAKRFIVHERIAADFEQRFVAAVKALAVGDPDDDATEVGPLASEQVLHDVADQVDRARRDGARVACGGGRIGTRGFYYAPTVVFGTPKSLWDEEVFGPVAPVTRARDLDHAIELANATRFGLGANAFTQDAAEMERLAEELEAGNVFINGMVKSDPRLPFGGIKASGYGRELSREGIREFMNAKTVWMG